MNARLVILILVAGALAIYFAMRSSAPPNEEDISFPTYPDQDEDRPKPEELELLSTQHIPGEEPPEDPEFDVRVEVDTSTGKNRLYLNITERHGYFAESFSVVIWYKDASTTGPDDSPLVLTHYINKYLKANETFRDCLEVVPAELANIGGDIGDTGDWEAKLSPYIGKVGRSLSQLRPVGTCEFDGERLECIAEMGVIDRDQRVKAIAVRGRNLSVAPADDTPATA